MKYKIPFRPIYTETLRQWLAEVVLCFVVYKLARPLFGPEVNQPTYETAKRGTEIFLD